jgi:predicted alpha/beta superfamily hydrolase
MVEVIETDSWAVRRAISLAFTSKVNGLEYRLGVSTPMLDAPPGGYPVLFVLDGDANFGAASETARSQSIFAPGVDAALVVAIGYPVGTLGDILRRRYCDLTTPAPPEPMTSSDPYFGSVSGGMEVFLDVIEHEIIPIIAGRFPVNDLRRALFGHSLGGLTSIRALLTRPALFDSVVASSPSLHWNQRAIFGDAEAFLALPPPSDTRPPALLISVGALEDGTFPMTGNARDMANRLEPAVGSGLRALSLHKFDDENHDSVVLPALSRAVRFAFKTNG